MAGLGFKDFAVGEVLTSADVDGYLMQQTVMRFADSGARGSALGTATGTAVPLAEGMLSYLTDTDAVELYDGSAWVRIAPGIGSNTVQTVLSSTFTSTSTSPTPITGLSVSITPSTTASKVLLVATVNFGVTSAATTDASTFLRFSKSSSALFVGDSAGTRPRVSSHLSRDAGWDSQGQMLTATLVFLDSPATTSSVTYDVDIWTSSSGTVYVNRSRNDTDGLLPRGASSFTAIEVSA